MSQMIEFPNEDAKWAWVAGFFEGEGCLHISPVGKNGFYSQIVITSGVKENLEVVRQITGGRIYLHKEHRGNRHLYYSLRLTKRSEQQEFISKIKPFLAGKREQAELMDEFLNQKAIIGRPFKHPEIERRREIHQQIKMLHARRNPRFDKKRNWLKPIKLTEPLPRKP